MTIRLIGVPFDGMGRKPGQAGALAALRAAGLEAALSSHEVVSQPDFTLPEARAERAPQSGLSDRGISSEHHRFAASFPEDRSAKYLCCLIRVET